MCGACVVVCGDVCGSSGGVGIGVVVLAMMVWW